MNTDEIQDALGKGLDPGIKEAVRLFNLAGLTTTQSCEGHSNHGLPGAWVDFPAALLATLQTYAQEFNSLREGDLIIRVLPRETHTRVTTMQDYDNFMREAQPWTYSDTGPPIKNTKPRPRSQEGHSLKNYGNLSRSTLTKFARYITESQGPTI